MSLVRGSDSVASYDEDAEDDDSSLPLPLPLLPLSPEEDEEDEEDEAGEEAGLACSSKSWPRSIGETKASAVMMLWFGCGWVWVCEIGKPGTKCECALDRIIAGGSLAMRPGNGWTEGRERGWRQGQGQAVVLGIVEGVPVAPLVVRVQAKASAAAAHGNALEGRRRTAGMRERLCGCVLGEDWNRVWRKAKW